MFVEELTILGHKQSLHERLQSPVTLHATQCSLHFDNSQKNEIHSLSKGA